MLTIIIGIFALGIVVFIHELGHFIAARLCGVTVETFSIGWGPALLKKKWHGTEYRISALPLGGYCGMKGEKEFGEALHQGLDSIPKEKGSFYGVHAWKRIVISFAGPFANLFFAVIALSFVSASGYTYKTYSNKIIPVISEYPSEKKPAELAGLLSGDAITSINGNQITYFSDLQQYIATHAEQKLKIEYSRNNQLFSTQITPLLDKKTGAGIIGVYPYIPLVVESIQEGSAAETAGLLKDDIITAVNSNKVDHFYQFESFLTTKPDQIDIEINRNGIISSRILTLVYDGENRAATGINWQTLTVTIKGTSVIKSILNGFIETKRTIQLTIKSLGLLFKGVDLSEAVSGPVRITVMIGEIAQSSFVGFMELMSIICVSLFLMNLLPIPILDGGQILFSFLEICIRRPLKPKTLYYVQFIGLAFILGIFALALFGDIKFLLK